jgi:hypothetical protein
MGSERYSPTPPRPPPQPPRPPAGIWVRVVLPVEWEPDPDSASDSRRISVAGITRRSDQEWMEQIARSATRETWGHLHPCRYVLHDRGTKFCATFRSILADGGVKTIRLPARTPNLNAFAERWVRSIKQECLSKLILFGEGTLSRTLAEFTAHYHGERNHQGKNNNLLFPDAATNPKNAVRLLNAATASEAYSSIMGASHE